MEIPHTPGVGKASGVGKTEKTGLLFLLNSFPHMSLLILLAMVTIYPVSTVCPKLFSSLQLHHLNRNAQNEQSSYPHFMNGQLCVKKRLGSLPKLTHSKWWSHDFCPVDPVSELMPFPFCMQDCGPAAVILSPSTSPPSHNLASLELYLKLLRLLNM